MIPEIHIEDFSYPLPDERIAKYPLPERDASKLLVYRDGIVSERKFRNLADELPAGSLTVFNDTKVVPARLFFRRSTGAHIEIFCLEPDDPAEYNSNFAATERCRWKCVIGNAKRWKDDLLDLDVQEGELLDFQLQARLVYRDGQTGVVEFSWRTGAPFSRVLELCGRIPIPPYIAFRCFRRRKHGTIRLFGYSIDSIVSAVIPFSCLYTFMVPALRKSAAKNLQPS